MSQCCDSLWLPSFVIRNADEMPQGRLQPYYITVDDASGVVTWRLEFRSNFYTSLDVQAFVSFLVFWFWRWRWRWWLWWLGVKRNRGTLTSFLSLCRTSQSFDNAALRFSGGVFQVFLVLRRDERGSGKTNEKLTPFLSFLLLCLPFYPCSASKSFCNT